MKKDILIILAETNSQKRLVVMQFESGTRILRMIHGRDARATSPNLHHYQAIPVFV